MVPRAFRRGVWCYAAAAFVAGAFGSVALSASPASPAIRGGAAQVEACRLLTPGDIEKAAGIAVTQVVPGRPVPGVLGRCSWLAAAGTRVIVTLTDASHANATMAAQTQGGGEAVPHIGSKAVAFPNAPVVGGGYMLTAVDAKGGFGVSVQGKEGTKERVIALARMVEARR